LKELASKERGRTEAKQHGGRLGALIGDDVLSAEPGDLPVPKTK
jgi:hypothetical protein